MKQWILVISILVVGLLVGGVIGYAAYSGSNNSSNLDKQITVLQNQNTNLTSSNANLTNQLDTLHNETLALQSSVTNLSAQVINLTTILNNTRDALLTPTEDFNYTFGPNGTCNFTLSSISNIGVYPKFLSVSIVPSEGVTIGPWATNESWLTPGDHFTIFGLISGLPYEVTFKYTPTPWAGSMGYGFYLPQGTFNVTSNATGEYNITLTAFSGMVTTPVVDEMLINGTMSWRGQTFDITQDTGYNLSQLHCGAYLAPGDYFTFTGGIPGTSYTLLLLYPAYPDFRVGTIPGYDVLASFTINIPS